MPRYSPPGSLTLISDQLLAASVASVSFPNIPQGFNHLRLVMAARTDRAANYGQVNCTFNGDSGANYTFKGPNQGSGIAASSFELGDIAGASAPAGYVGCTDLLIPNYAQTSLFKSWAGIANWQDGTDNANGLVTGTWLSTAAITSLALVVAGGSNFIAGSRVTLYGMS